MNILKIIDATWFWSHGYTFEYTMIEELDEDDHDTVDYMGFFCISGRIVS